MMILIRVSASRLLKISSLIQETILTIINALKKLEREEGCHLSVVLKRNRTNLVDTFNAD